MFITQFALAWGSPLAKPVILDKGKFKPIPCKNSCIATSDACGLAVKTKMSLLPLASAIVLANWNNGPFLPSITLSNSTKSNKAPLLCSSIDLAANSLALILDFLPLGIVTITLLFVLAKVSSKSKTLIFLTGAFKSLAILAAVS